VAVGIPPNFGSVLGQLGIVLEEHELVLENNGQAERVGIRVAQELAHLVPHVTYPSFHLQKYIVRSNYCLILFNMIVIINKKPINIVYVYNHIIIYPATTYYWTVSLIFDHSCLDG
jgi:hypothetical protein